MRTETKFPKRHSITVSKCRYIRRRGGKFVPFILLPDSRWWLRCAFYFRGAMGVDMNGAHMDDCSWHAYGGAGRCIALLRALSLINDKEGRNVVKNTFPELFK